MLFIVILFILQLLMQIYIIFHRNRKYFYLVLDRKVHFLRYACEKKLASTLLSTSHLLR